MKAEIYELHGVWWWQMRDGRGEVIAASRRSYNRPVDAKRALYRLLEVNEFEVTGMPARSK